MSLTTLSGLDDLTAIVVLTAKSLKKNEVVLCFIGLDRWSGLDSNSGLHSYKYGKALVFLCFSGRSGRWFRQLKV